jgi:hypothetical protein
MSASGNSWSNRSYVKEPLHGENFWAWKRQVELEIMSKGDGLARHLRNAGKRDRIIALEQANNLNANQRAELDKLDADNDQVVGILRGNMGASYQERTANLRFAIDIWKWCNAHFVQDRRALTNLLNQLSQEVYTRDKKPEDVVAAHISIHNRLDAGGLQMDDPRRSST